MIDLGLTKAQDDAYRAALVTSHRIRTKVLVLDANEAPVKGLVPQVLSGAVTVEASAAVSRSLSMTLLDPNHKLTFDSASPADGALYADNFVQVTYGVETSLGWVDVPVFTGPVTGYSRSGHEVSVEAQGKESLAMDPQLVVSTINVHRNTLISDAISAVMGKAGESTKHVSLGMVKGRVVHARAIHRGESPWAVCTGGGSDSSGNPKPGLIAKATGRPFLYYDGRGTLTAKNRGGPPKFTFTERHVTSEPGYTYDVLAARNYVYVTGGKPAKAKQPSAVTSEPGPQRPAALPGRDGHGRHAQVQPGLRCPRQGRPRPDGKRGPGGQL